MSFGGSKLFEDDSSNEAPIIPFLRNAEPPSPFLWAPNHLSAAQAFSVSPRSAGLAATGALNLTSQIPPAVMAAFEDPSPSPDQSRRQFASQGRSPTVRAGTPELPYLLSTLSVESPQQRTSYSPPKQANAFSNHWAVSGPSSSSPFNPDSQEFVPNGMPQSMYMPGGASHAGIHRRPYPTPLQPPAMAPQSDKQVGSTNGYSSRHIGTFNTLSIDTNTGEVSRLPAPLLSPPLDPKKKREHVSAPNSPLSPPLVADPTRSLPSRAFTGQRMDPQSMKRRKLEFGDDQASPTTWRQAAESAYNGNSSPPKSPTKLEPMPASLLQLHAEHHSDTMDYVGSEMVDLNQVVTSDSSFSSVDSSMNQDSSSEPRQTHSGKSHSRAKQSVRNFLREFGMRSKSGFVPAKNYALNLNNSGNSSSPEKRSQPSSPTSNHSSQYALREMPAQVRSQVCLELADLAKRESEFAQARMFYRASTQLDPLNAKAWLEYAKCEEENGHLFRAQRILSSGFKNCCTSPESATVDRVSRESIILRMLRLFSRTGEIEGVRTLLGAVLEQFLHQQEVEKANSMGGGGGLLSRSTNSTISEDMSEPMGSNPPSPTRRTPSSSPTKPSYLTSIMTAAQSAQSAAPAQDDESAPGSFPWRVVMEGANLEWKFGRRKLAHAVMQYLHQFIPTRAQPYVRFLRSFIMFAADLYKKEGRFEDAYRVILTGIQNLPSAGMLYFEALQLMELIATSQPAVPSWKTRIGHSRHASLDTKWVPFFTASPVLDPDSMQKDMMALLDAFGGSERPEDDDPMEGIIQTSPLMSGPSTADLFSPKAKSYSWTLMELVENILPLFMEKALANLSPELVWKFHAETASLFERSGEVIRARHALALCERSIPDTLGWKVWLHGAKIELSFGNETVTRRLLMEALQGVPKKMQAQVLVEWAHVEEVLERRDTARYILENAIVETQNDWKVMLELVLLELRSGNLEAAIEAAKRALVIHPSTGRLWSVLIQLEHLRNYNDPTLATPFAVFREALQEVPKSGEVWCEGARLAIHVGRLDEARKFLDFSLHFTPQYGDSLIEYLRLDLLDASQNGPVDVSRDLSIQSKLYRICAHAEPDYGPVWAFCKQSPLENGLESILFRNAKAILLSLPADRKMDISTYLAELDFSKLSVAERRRILFG